MNASTHRQDSSHLIATLARMAQLEPGLKDIVQEFIQSWPYVDERAPANISMVGMQYSGIPQLTDALLAADRKRPDHDMSHQEQSHEGQGYTLVRMPSLRDISWSEGIAWRGLRSTDLVLYVHNAKHEVLHDEGRRFLRRLVSWAPKTTWRSKMAIPVLTHCDDLSADEMNTLSAHINTQWLEIMGVEPMAIFGVCTRHYMAAHEAQDDDGMEASMIPRLRSFLNLISHVDQLATLRQAKEHMMVQQIAQLAARRAHQTREDLDARVEILQSEATRMRASFDALQETVWDI